MGMSIIASFSSMAYPLFAPWLLTGTSFAQDEASECCASAFGRNWIYDRILAAKSWTAILKSYAELTFMERQARRSMRRPAARSR